MLNQVPVIPVGRQPRGLVTINGDEVIFLEFEVDNNNFYLADTFQVVIPLTGNRPGIDLSYFYSQPAILIEIFAGFPQNPSHYNKNELMSLIVAQVDSVNVHLDSRTVTLAGRDLTAKFIDAKTMNKYPNLTSSQIVTQLAKARGLAPVITETKTKVGIYYQDELVRLTSQSSEWDLINFLAQEEGFAAYVKGMELHFEPYPDTNSDPYVIQYKHPDPLNNISQSNVISLEIERNLTLAKDIIVKVRTFNPKTKKPVTKVAKATHNKNSVLAGKAQPIGEAQTYVYVRNGFTPEQALQFAQQELKRLSSHEMKLTALLQADNILSCRNMIQVKGTNSPLDQKYFPNSIVRHMSYDGGYEMTVHAKNHSPESEVLV